MKLSAVINVLIYLQISLSNASSIKNISNYEEFNIPNGKIITTPSNVVDGKENIQVKDENLPRNESGYTENYDEFDLPDELLIKLNSTETKHIYRVPKKPQNKLMDMKKKMYLTVNALPFVASNSTYDTVKYTNSFQLFTNLYDHNNWNIDEMQGKISQGCESHMRMYLNDLKTFKLWALKGGYNTGHFEEVSRGL